MLKHHFTESIIQKHMVHVIGYGSGVFPQQTKKMNNTIDLIIVAKDSHQFHSEFTHLKPSDYQGLTKFFGPAYLKFLNQNIFPMHFNHV